MTVETSIETFFAAQWGATTTIVYPNTETSQMTPVDKEITASIFVLPIDVVDLGVPIRPGTARRERYILQINLSSPNKVGAGQLNTHIQTLNGIFRNETCVLADSNTYYFGQPIRRSPFTSDTAYIVPWECEFTVYYN